MSALETVYNGSNPIEAEILCDLLQQQGIQARLLGTRNAAMLGAGQHIFALRIEVPTEEAVEASALVHAFAAESANGLVPEEEAGPRPAELSEDEGEWEADESAGPTPRRRFPAAGAALVIPGGSHLYLGRSWTAVWFACSFGVAFYVFASFGTRGFFTGISMMASVVLLDLFRGQWLLHRINRGARAGALQQHIDGLGFALVAAGLGLASAVWLLPLAVAATNG